MAHSESNFFSKISFTKSGYVAKESYKIIVKALKEEHSKSLFNNKVFSTEIDSKLTAEQKIVILELIVEELFDEAAEIIKREILISLAIFRWKREELKLALKVISKYELEFKDKMDLTEATKNNIKGLIYWRIGKLNIALKELYKALNYFKEDSNGVLKRLGSIININNNIALIYEQQKDYNGSIKIYTSNIELQKKYKHKEGLSMSYMNIASSYQLNNETVKAINFSKFAQILKYEIGDILQAERINVNLADCYFIINDIENAETYAKLSVDSKDEMTRNYGQLYLFKVLLKKYESDDKNTIQKQELLVLANKCYKILTDINDSEFKIENYPFIAKAYQYTGEFEKSIKILNERFDLYTIVIENKNIESYKQIRESHEIQLQQKELEKKEQLLQQKEALNNKLKQVNDELEQFTSMASHDLKSPLRTILTLCGFMKEGDLAAAEMNEYLSLIESDAVKMDNLINSLLRYSKIGYNNVEKEKIDLTDLINNVKVNLSTEIKNRNASINIENLPEIKGNKVLLEQLFQNLINNALKYNENQKPEITIRSEEIRNTIEIQDNGIGIPENKIQDIFKAFTRAHSASKYEGSGVGLATCKKIMDIHSGTISVSSEVGKGSCFSLRFAV